MSVAHWSGALSWAAACAANAHLHHGRLGSTLRSFETLGLYQHLLLADSPASGVLSAETSPLIACCTIETTVDGATRPRARCWHLLHSGFPSPS